MDRLRRRLPVTPCALDRPRTGKVHVTDETLAAAVFTRRGAAAPPDPARCGSGVASDKE